MYRRRLLRFPSRLLSAGLLALAALAVPGAGGFAAGAARPGVVAIPAPRDIPYEGQISLQVDVSDVQRRIFEVRERIPVRPGHLTLLYPRWLPGKHAPRGPIEQLAGLVIEASPGGRRIEWRRDPLDVYAFHLEVPAGVRQISVAFQLASPQSTDNLDRVLVTSELLNLQWIQVVLYPAGHYNSRIQVAAQVRLPPGWQFAAALEVEKRDADTVSFRPQSLETLADSPLFAGRHFRQFELAPSGSPPVRLNVFGERAANLAVTPEQLETHRRIVREAYAALGPPHFDRYDFLLALSDTLGGIGLEHHRSSENTQHPGYFTDADSDVGGRDLLVHEFTHSWNGKYRRPARLWTPNYNVPMQDNLLWVYEGMTQYWGTVLSARAGLWTPQFTRDVLALVAAVYERKRAGRNWRSLEDTTHQPITAARRPLSWPSWQRGEDYYDEGMLIWLDVDTKLRELTHDARSLDDVARGFFAAPSRRGIVATYELADVVQALEAVVPFDWAAFLEQRTAAVTPQAPLDGLARSGWQLVYKDEPSAYVKDVEKDRKLTDLSYSLGMVISRDAELSEVVWGGPAFAAGLTRGTTIIAVNGTAFDAGMLKEAITAAKDPAVPLELLVKRQDRFRTVRIDYRGGLQYPHLEPIAGAVDRLAQILKPRG